MGRKNPNPGSRIYIPDPNHSTCNDFNLLVDVNYFFRPALYLPTHDKYTIAVRFCPVYFKLRPIKRKNGPKAKVWLFAPT
jgi:hypothetical protein